MRKGILFDLGNTLVQYFNRNESLFVLEKCLDSVSIFLEKLGISLDYDNIKHRIEKENYELSNHKVRHLEKRLFKIFRLEKLSMTSGVELAICSQFLKPVFPKSKVYEDTLPILSELKSRGYKLGIVSNMPWGSPSEPWKIELQKAGISKYIDNLVFCSDLG